MHISVYECMLYNSETYNFQDGKILMSSTYFANLKCAIIIPAKYFQNYVWVCMCVNKSWNLLQHHQIQSRYNIF